MKREHIEVVLLLKSIFFCGPTFIEAFNLVRVCAVKAFLLRKFLWTEKRKFETMIMSINSIFFSIHITVT